CTAIDAGRVARPSADVTFFIANLVNPTLADLVSVVSSRVIDRRWIRRRCRPADGISGSRPMRRVVSKRIAPFGACRQARRARAERMAMGHRDGPCFDGAMVVGKARRSRSALRVGAAAKRERPLHLVPGTLIDRY